MRRNRQTKIVATLGPASDTAEMIARLFEAGVDMFRLNFSHGSAAEKETLAAAIRTVGKDKGRPVAILADLQGPKLRIGTFKGGFIELKKGQRLRFDSDPDPGDDTRVCLPHPDVLDNLEPGQKILLDDGKVHLKVTKTGTGFMDAEVLAGTRLSDKKGLNLPGMIIPIPALTDKDKEDLETALALGADWIAQSFVQKTEDVREAAELIKGRAALMVKLEKPSALACLEELLALADGVMLARGDLGVEIPPEDVPSVQKHVVRAARASGRPVVVATQMLESMIKSPQPTRAEASDVATAVYDGADAVMLSAETAAGDYPLQAVEIMDRICQRTESDETYRRIREADHPDTVPTPSDAITTAAYYVAQDIEAAAIVNYTMSGATALRTARQRPAVPILCLTPDEKVARRLCLSYGVHAVHTPEQQSDFTGPARHAARIALEQGMVEKGHRFVMTAGVPFGTPGSTNILRIAKVE